MRRMRDLYWGYLIVVLPVLAAALGIHHMLSDRGETGHQDSTVLKPSAMLSGDEHRGDGIREAMVQEDALRYEADEEDLAETDSTQTGTRFVAQSVSDEEAARLNSEFEKTQPAECKRVEFAGKGPSVGEPNTHTWAAVMNEFWGVKGKLQAWVQKNRDQFGAKTANALEQKIKDLRIERPPTPAEPDLSWRGIGVLSSDGQGQVIRLGGGFLKLLEQSPRRARFELTRLVAQTWSPCHLQKIPSSDANWDPVLSAVWEPLLKCIGVEAEGCGPGSYSESGWAISSALAVAVSGTGCSVPAFADSGVNSCLDRLPFPKTARTDFDESAKVAKR